MNQPMALAAQKIVRPDLNFATDDLPDLQQILEEFRPLGPVIAVNGRRGPTWLFLDTDEMRRGFIDQVDFDITVGKRIIEEPHMGYNLQMMPIAAPTRRTISFRSWLPRARVTSH